MNKIVGEIKPNSTLIKYELSVKRKNTLAEVNKEDIEVLGQASSSTHTMLQANVRSAPKQLIGTPVPGYRPGGGALKKLHLPESVINLTLRNQTALTEFVMPSYRNVSTLWIENVSSVVDPLEILSQIPANSRVRLIGVHMVVDSYLEIVDFVAQLDTMRGIDENNLNVATAQVSGTIYLEEVMQPQLNEIVQWQSRYPSLAVLYNRVKTYTVCYWNDDTLFDVVSDVKWGEAARIPVGIPVRANSGTSIWEFTEWSPVPDRVVSDMDVYAQYRDSTLLSVDLLRKPIPVN